VIRLERMSRQDGLPRPVAALAVALPTAALLRWLGTAGIGASMHDPHAGAGAELVGRPTLPSYLPGFFDTAGEVLPADPARDALRAVVYLDGHGTGDPLLVLVGWALVGRAASSRPPASAATSSQHSRLRK
jgi:hypothetical protein